MSVRVCVVQPLVPRYRVPVFEQLAACRGLELEVWADVSGQVGSLAGITSSDRIRLRPAPYREVRGIVWHPAVLAAVQGDFDAVVLPWNVRSPHLYRALAVRRRPPVVLWGHGFGTHHDRAGNLLRRWTAMMADACLFYGPTGRANFARRGVSSEQLFVAPNAVDQGAIQAARDPWSRPETLEAFHRDTGFHGRPYMLFMSRLEAEKLPHLAIEALCRIRRARPDAALVFIGDGSRRADLERLVGERGLAEHVRFLGALHDEKLIAPWACGAQMLIHPGALGLTIFHAFGYGLPVVTTDAMHLQMPEVEALESGTNGLTYAHADLESLSATCIRLLNDATLRKHLSSGALRTVLSEGGRNIESMVAGIEASIRFAATRRTRFGGH